MQTAHGPQAIKLVGLQLGLQFEQGHVVDQIEDASKVTPLLQRRGRRVLQSEMDFDQSEVRLRLHWIQVDLIQIIDIQGFINIL